MNQREMLETFISYMNHDMRLIFVNDWLEDMNWHGESEELRQFHMETEMVERWGVYEKMQIAINRNSYSKSHFDGLDKDMLLAPYIMAVEHMREWDWCDIVENGKHYRVNREEMMDYNMTQEFYKAMSYAFGWGIDSSCWKSGGSGTAFVKELVEMIETVKKT